MSPSHGSSGYGHPRFQVFRRLKSLVQEFPCQLVPVQDNCQVCQSIGSTKIILEALFAVINAPGCWTAFHPAILSTLGISSLKHKEMQPWQMVLGSDLYSKASRVKLWFQLNFTALQQFFLPFNLIFLSLHKGRKSVLTCKLFQALAQASSLILDELANPVQQLLRITKKQAVSSHCQAWFYGFPYKCN